MYNLTIHTFEHNHTKQVIHIKLPYCGFYHVIVEYGKNTFIFLRKFRLSL